MISSHYQIFLLINLAVKSIKKIKRISTSALDMLMAYHWPGNVRELANVIERAVLMSENGVLQGRDLPPSLQMPDNLTQKSSLELRLQQVEKDLIIDCLRSYKGNIRQAAIHLGLTERKMGLRIKRYQIDRLKFKKNDINVDNFSSPTFM